MFLQIVMLCALSDSVEIHYNSSNCTNIKYVNKIKNDCLTNNHRCCRSELYPSFSLNVCHKINETESLLLYCSGSKISAPFTFFYMAGILFVTFIPIAIIFIILQKSQSIYFVKRFKYIKINN